MNPEHKELLNQIATGNYTAQQAGAFQDWIDEADEAEYLAILMAWEEVLVLHPTAELPDQALLQRIASGLDELKKDDSPTVPLYTRNQKSSGLKTYLAIAATVVVMVSTGLFFFFNHKNQSGESLYAGSKHDFPPGGNKAVLTLADGTVINLDEANTGAIASQAGIKITKTKDGQLIYHISPLNTGASKTEDTAEEALPYNTITTPRGGQYQVNLPDGTKVWLNAASSLRYPVLFGSKERKVELSGEAYFEVAKDKIKPFRVLSNQQVVEVLGTHFNINSYHDEENTRTTLLEGSVKVFSHLAKQSILLKPGEQSQVEGSSLSVKAIDADGAIAWKNGFFVFNAENIPSVMRKISRWYDLEVIYEGNVNDQDLAGSVSCFKNVSEVLNTLELTGLVHFKMEGRRITVIAK